MSGRKPDQTRNIGLKDIGQIGFPKADKEPWGAVAKRVGESDTAQSRTDANTNNGDN